MIRLKNSNKTLLFTACCLFLLSCFIGNSNLLLAEEPDGSPPAVGLPDGYKLIEGDILVPQITTRGLFATNWWTNAVVPYEFDGNVSSARRATVLEAMAEWEAVANVIFVPHNVATNYIHIQDHSTENSSMVGMDGGEQIVNIHTWHELFVIVHELGHALGLWHEQSRPDRNSYITVHFDRIQEDKEHNFDIHSSDGYIIGPYDFLSLMHYGQCAFSNCDDCWNNKETCRTISMKPGWESMQELIGLGERISDLDAITMWMMYPPSNTIFVDTNNTGIQAGTLYWPFKTFNAGYASVPNLGTIVVQPGSYNETGVYTKAITVMAPLGGVTLGE